MDNTAKSLIKRTVLFLLLAAFIVPFLSLIVGFPVAFLSKSFVEEADNFFAGLAVIYYGLLFSSPIVYYLDAKLFGIFKLIDELKIALYKKILILFLISALLYIILNLVFFGLDDMQFNMACIFGFGFGLIPAFFLYKLFQYLTKKYPHPFEKIGYYSSIEFYKKFFKKRRVRNNINTSIDYNYLYFD